MSCSIQRASAASCGGGVTRSLSSPDLALGGNADTQLFRRCDVCVASTLEQRAPIDITERGRDHSNGCERRIASTHVGWMRDDRPEPRSRARTSSGVPDSVIATNCSGRRPGMKYGRRRAFRGVADLLETTNSVWARSPRTPPHAPLPDWCCPGRQTPRTERLGEHVGGRDSIRPCRHTRVRVSPSARTAAASARGRPTARGDSSGARIHLSSFMAGKK